VKWVLTLSLAAVAGWLLWDAASPTTLLLAAALGGVVAWLWGAISWMALPWHHVLLRRFEGEEEFVRVLERAAPVSGVYGYPGVPCPPPGATPEQRAAADRDVLEQMRRGPLVLAFVERRGFPPVWRPMLGALAVYMFVSLLLGWLLLHAPGLPYGRQVLFVAAVGLAGAALCRLPDWNWHRIDVRWTGVLVADATVCWTLVGLVLAALL
jgi:hypothetical protein